jgi:tetratricopeptide (TPR) repeat protein
LEAEAQRLFTAGRPAEARDLWTRVLSSGLSRAEKRRTAPWIGRTYEAEGNYQKALSAYQEAYDADPSSVDRLVDLARMYNTVALDERALELYERAQKKDRTRRDVELAIGDIHFRAGRFKDARRCAENVWRRDPRDPAAQLLLARVEEAEGNLPAAAQRREKLLSDRPSAEGAVWVGRLWARVGELELAEEAFRRAADLGDVSALLAFERGALAWRRGDMEAAQKWLETALGRDPSFSSATVLMSVMDWERGRSARAMERLRSLSLSPDSPVKTLRDRLLSGVLWGSPREETK